MRNVTTLALWLMALALSLVACGKGDRKVWVPDNYREWEHTINEVLSYPIAGHGPTYRVIYINKEGTHATETVRDGRDWYEYPPGTIIVKEVYQDRNAVQAGTPFQLTVMIKAPEAPEAVDGWVWVVKDTASGNETVFQSTFCIDCHSDANERHRLGWGNPIAEFQDFVFFPYLEYQGARAGKDNEPGE
ncbi:MAG TPA: hypothetical protein ENN69_01210 [Spirochaetia bacterium]|nr:hypothetical protein [Spirochaetia bacterium]